MNAYDWKKIKSLNHGEIWFYNDGIKKTKVKLGGKVLSDGRLSLFVDYYLGYDFTTNPKTGKESIKKERRRESINLHLWQNPKTQAQKQENADNEIIALKRLSEKRLALADDAELKKLRDKRSKSNRTNFITWYEKYIETYTKADVRVIALALSRFKDFLSNTPKYKRYKDNIAPEQITNTMMYDYTEYLQTRSKGSGAKTLYQRFKKAYKVYATKNGLNPYAPFTNSDGQRISITIDENTITKDFLSPDEIKLLIQTHYPGENKEIRRAFIFSLNTGMRWCDVKDLTFAEFDFANKTLCYNQNKTKGHSSKSKVTLFLTDTLVDLLGEKPEKRNKTDLVFDLPSHTMALKMLRRWTKEAGINKHITFHCARHSFGTNMASTVAQKGYSIRLVQEMMGHANLKYTEIYTHVVDEQKRQAQTELSKLFQE